MTPLQRRFRRIVARLGEPYTAGGATRRAIFGVLGSGLASSYLTRAESDAAGRPFWAAYAPDDDPTAAGATLAWNGRTLTVLRAVDLRAHGATAARLLVLNG